MSNRRWWIAALLFLSTLLNYFDRQILALVSPVLRVQFSLTAVEYSHLLNAFLLGYTSMQFIAGWIVDRIGARRGLMLAMLWWSVAGAAAATSHNPRQLGLFLFLMGVGEAANWPTAVKAIREWFPPERRATAVGFFNAGSATGAIIAPVVIANLTLHYSWRAAFLVCGILGLLWIVPWRFVYTRSPLLTEVTAGRAIPHFAFLKDRRAWGIIMARFFADSIWFFYIFWLPDYLTHVQSLSLREIGATAWIPFLAAGLGNFAGGAASSYLIRKHHSVVSSRLIVMGVSAFVMTFGAAIQFCHSPLLAIAFISVIVFAYSAWASNILTLPGDIFPSSMVATVVGASGSLAGIGGMLTTFIAGRVIDRYSYDPVFWGLACLPILALACSLLTYRPHSQSTSISILQT